MVFDNESVTVLRKLAGSLHLYINESSNLKAKGMHSGAFLTWLRGLFHNHSNFVADGPPDWGRAPVLFGDSPADDDPGQTVAGSDVQRRHVQPRDTLAPADHLAAGVARQYDDARAVPPRAQRNHADFLDSDLAKHRGSGETSGRNSDLER